MSCYLCLELGCLATTRSGGCVCQREDKSASRNGIGFRSCVGVIDVYTTPQERFFLPRTKPESASSPSSASEVTAQPIRKTPHSHHADLRAARRVHIHHSRRSCLHPEATRATSAAKNRAARTAHATTLRMNRVRGGYTLRHGSRMCGAPLSNVCSSSRPQKRRVGHWRGDRQARGWLQHGSARTSTRANIAARTMQRCQDTLY